MKALSVKTLGMVSRRQHSGADHPNAVRRPPLVEHLLLGLLCRLGATKARQVLINLRAQSKGFPLEGLVQIRTALIALIKFPFKVSHLSHLQSDAEVGQAQHGPRQGRAHCMKMK